MSVYAFWQPLSNKVTPDVGCSTCSWCLHVFHDYKSLLVKTSPRFSSVNVRKKKHIQGFFTLGFSQKIRLDLQWSFSYWLSSTTTNSVLCFWTIQDSSNGCFGFLLRSLIYNRVVQWLLFKYRSPVTDGGFVFFSVKSIQRNRTWTPIKSSPLITNL